MKTELRRWPQTKTVLSVSLMSLLCAMAASAQGPPALTSEIHAAYCIPVLQKDLSYIQQLVEAVETSLQHIEEVPTNVRPQALALLKQNQRDLPQQAAARRTTLNRLQSYLEPRMQRLDAQAVKEATESGEADVQEMAGEANRCSAQCSRTGADETNPACMTTCTNAELAARLTACRNPTWLPP